MRQYLVHKVRLILLGSFHIPWPDSASLIGLQGNGIFIKVYLTIPPNKFKPTLCKSHRRTLYSNGSLVDRDCERRGGIMMVVETDDG